MSESFHSLSVQTHFCLTLETAPAWYFNKISTSISSPPLLHSLKTGRKQKEIWEDLGDEKNRVITQYEKEVKCTKRKKRMKIRKTMKEKVLHCFRKVGFKKLRRKKERKNKKFK